MAQASFKPPMATPTFSMVIETENLANAELEGLSRCLDSLAAQDLSPSCANEVLIVESGDVPSEMMEHLQTAYPWITIRTIERGTEYYEAKMKGAALTTGEIIVLCDSDCIYERSWLRNLLAPFSSHSEVHVVAGETTTPASGPYSVAIALTYIFPRFSRCRTPGPASSYFCNNVAFRRSFLFSHPIATDLPLYRGNCVLHAQSLGNDGGALWKQPNARASHAAPNGLSHFFWRFLLLGYDALAIARLTSPAQPALKPIRSLSLFARIAVHQVRKFAQRIASVFAEDPRRLIYLPLTLPIALASQLLFFSGLVLNFLKPDYFLSPDRKVEARWQHS